MKTRLVKIIAITMIMVVMLGTASSAYGSYPSFTIDVSDRINEMLDTTYTYGYIVMLTKLDGTVATDTAPYAIITSNKRLDTRIDQIYDGTTLYDIITTSNDTSFRRKTFSDSNPISSNDSPKYTTYGPYSNNYEIYNGAITNRNPIIIWTTDGNIAVNPDFEWNKIERLSLIAPENGSTLYTTQSAIVFGSYADKIKIILTNVTDNKYVDDYILPVNQSTHSTSIKVSDLSYQNNKSYRMTVENLNNDLSPTFDNILTVDFAINLSANNSITISGVNNGETYLTAPQLTIIKGGSYIGSVVNVFLNNQLFRTLPSNKNSDTFSLYSPSLDILNVGKNSLVVKAGSTTYSSITFSLKNPGEYTPGTTIDISDKPERPENGDIIEWLVYIFDSIGYTFKIAAQAAKDVISNIGGIGKLLSSFFEFIPSEIFSILFLGVSVVVIIAIFKAARN